MVLIMEYKVLILFVLVQTYGFIKKKKKKSRKHIIANYLEEKRIILIKKHISLYIYIPKGEYQ